VTQTFPKGHQELDSFAATLRSCREQAGLSVDKLATRTGYSASYLRKLERGERRPTAQVAHVCDTALGTTPYLQALLSIERGDPMIRRALLGGGFAAALLATQSTAALAAALHYGATEGTTDWQATVADFTRRHLLDPGPDFGAQIAAQIEICRHAATQGDRDAARAAAQLATVYGLHMGDLGMLPHACALHRTAAAIADTCGDPAVRAQVRARAASRGIYEQWTRQRVADNIDEALHLHPHGAAALEAHAARVHLAALTGDLDGGRRAVTDMRRTAEHLDDFAHQRTAEFSCYLECRLATLPEATRAYEHADKVLAHNPLWHTDATIAYAGALVRHGNTEPGARLALDAIKAQYTPVRVLGVCVADVVRAAADRRSPALDELTRYATPGPHPWQTI
jgi:transcriptional regulator with XRE-family HTH domain